MRKCLLISPRFPDLSYWNYREVCEIFGARYVAAPLGLITVAALLPQDWEIRLLDLNVDEMNATLVDWADIVMAGGMIPQQRNLVALIEFCHARGKLIVVGGQDPTAQPAVYASADFLVLDEGEMTIPPFLADLEAGARHGIYRSAERPELTVSPTPRFDLLQLKKYLHVGVQFSRGCPFNCEFCDIIELYGRRPRTKTPQQLLRELDCLYQLGYRGHVDFVDDNFVGNKKALKALLPEVLVWSQRRDFPFFFTTEATINLADDPTLLAVMEALDFRYVFVGIETPDPALLRLTLKKVNTRHPLVACVQRLNSHGIVVTAGFILGFDGETRNAGDNIVACVESAGIPMALISLLWALPTTQLLRRLTREGRMPAGSCIQPAEGVDQATTGLNFIPARPRAEILADYVDVVRRLYSPKGYFGRVRTLAQQLARRPKQRGSLRGWKNEFRALGVVVWRLGFRRDTAWAFWRTALGVLLTRPQNLEAAIHLMALYLHYRSHTRFVLDGLERKLADLKPDCDTANRPDSF